MLAHNDSNKRRTLYFIFELTKLWYCVTTKPDQTSVVNIRVQLAKNKSYVVFKKPFGISPKMTRTAFIYEKNGNQQQK